MWQDNGGLIGRGAGGARSCSCRAGKGGGAGEGELAGKSAGRWESRKGVGRGRSHSPSPNKSAEPAEQEKGLGRRQRDWRETGGRQQALPENPIVGSFIGYSLIYACTRERMSLEGITMEWQQLSGVIRSPWFKFWLLHIFGSFCLRRRMGIPSPLHTSVQWAWFEAKKGSYRQRCPVPPVTLSRGLVNMGSAFLSPLFLLSHSDIFQVPSMTKN